MLKKINAARDILCGGVGSADGWEAEPGDIPKQANQGAQQADDWSDSAECETETIHDELAPAKAQRSAIPIALLGVLCGGLVIAAFSVSTNQIQYQTQESLTPTSPIASTYSSSVQPEPKLAASDPTETQSVPEESDGDTNSEDALPTTPEDLPYLSRLSLEKDDLAYGVEGKTTVRARVYSYDGQEEVLCRLEASTSVRVDTTTRADWLAIALPNRNRGLIRAKQVALSRALNSKADSTYERDPVPKDESQASSAANAFTIGSTMEQVKAVQGTPTSVASYGWSYELSTVRFDSEGRVSGYSNLGKNLKVEMLPFDSHKQLSRFTIGSTKDDVLLVQGTPTGVASYGWHYELSTVRFDSEGKVVGYSNLGKNLKVE